MEMIIFNFWLKSHFQFKFMNFQYFLFRWVCCNYSRMTEIGVCVAIVSRELIMHPTRKHYYNISDNYILYRHKPTEQIPIIHLNPFKIPKYLKNAVFSKNNG